MSLTNMTDEEWSEHVRNGEAFAGETLTTGAVGMFAHDQIFNPAGSGVRVRLWVLEGFTVFNIAVNRNLRRHDVALGVVAPFAGPENLLGGGAAPAAELRSASLAALTGSPFWVMLGVGARRTDYPPLDQVWGHDLLPGQGFVSTTGAAGGFNFNGWMWAEVPL